MNGAAVSLAAALLAATGAAAPVPVPVPMPGGAAGIGFDDLRYSPELARVVVPAGRTGKLDLVDPRTRAVEPVDGFSRTDSPTRGHGDGTTSADVGDGFVFAIDRTDRTLVAVDPRERRIVARAALGGAPDYVRWVGATGEVWVTEPGRERIEVFRFERAPAPALASTATIAVPAGPEALVVDSAKGRAYTNTFKDVTVAIDVRARAVAARWSNGCRGARGIALDARRGLVFVGCEEGKAVALEVSRGKQVGTVEAGKGVDGIAYSDELAHLYVPAGDAATVTIVQVGEHGELHALGTLPAVRDAHCAAADDRGNVWICDPGQGRLLVVADPFAHRG
jgi:DNA-binding beta-propeller fold protein YncE